MGTQLIEYQYSGDEAAWRSNIETFFAHIRADPILREGLHYAVFVRPDGISRVHVPNWRDQSVLDHLFAQPFFKVFSTAVNSQAAEKPAVTKPDLMA